MKKLTDIVRSKIIEEEWGRPYEPVGSLYKQGTIGYEKAKARRKANRESWMAEFEKNVVSKNSAHAGKIDWNTARYLHFGGHTPDAAAQKYLSAKNESVELEEGNVPKVSGFSNFKQMAQDWADNNTHHGKIDLQKRDVPITTGILRQTISVGQSNTGKSFVIGVFNHNTKGSEEGHGWHHHRTQGINESLDEAYSETIKKVAKNLAARPNKGAMPAAGRVKKMTEEEVLDEGRMKELAMDLDDMGDMEFHKKYNKSKEEWKGILGAPPATKKPAPFTSQRSLRGLRTRIKKAAAGTTPMRGETRKESTEVDLDEATLPKYDPAKMDEFEAGREFQHHADRAAFHRNSQGWTGKFNDIYNRDWKKEAAYHERHMKALKKVLDYHKTHKEEAINDYPTLDEEINLQEVALSPMHPVNINAIIKMYGQKHKIYSGSNETKHGLGVKELKAKLGVGSSASVHKKFVNHMDKAGFKSSWSHSTNEWVYNTK